MARLLKAILPNESKRMLKNLYYKIHSTNLIIGKKVSISTSCSFEEGVCLGQGVQVNFSSIGQKTYLGANTVISQVRIGRYCAISSNVQVGLGAHPSSNIVSIHPSFFSPSPYLTAHYADKEYFAQSLPITIGNDVWIGTGAKIKDGIKIGDGAIIGAGAMVTRDIEPYSIVGGVPAKLIRYRFEPEEIKFLLEFKWWNKSEEWLKDNWKKFLNIKEFIDSFK